MSKQARLDELIKCKKCNKTKGHSCPYQLKVRNNPDSNWCHCCPKHEQECRDNV